MKKRGIYIIKPGFQVKVILLFIVLGLSGSLLSGVLLYFNLEKRFNSLLYTAHFQVSNAGEVVFPVIVTVTLNVVLLSLLAVCVAIVYMSRRMESVFAMFSEKCLFVKEGDLTIRVPCLYNNLTDDLTACLNSVILSLENSCQRKQRSLDAIFDFAVLFERMLKEKGSLPELCEIHARLSEKLGELEREVERFSVSS